MYYPHRLPTLRLVAHPSPDRSAKVVALRSRSEALKEDRVPRPDPGPSHPRAAA